MVLTAEERAVLEALKGIPEFGSDRTALVRTLIVEVGRNATVALGRGRKAASR